MVTTTFDQRVHPMRHIERGFTFIELMIVVVIIGILAAVALPAYQEYAVRAKVSELVLTATGLTATIVEVAQGNNTLTGSGNGLSVATTGKVKYSNVSANGTITIAGDSSSSSVGKDVTIILTPLLNTDGKVTWVCSSGAISQWRYVPPECRH